MDLLYCTVISVIDFKLSAYNMQYISSCKKKNNNNSREYFFFSKQILAISHCLTCFLPSLTLSIYMEEIHSTYGRDCETEFPPVELCFWTDVVKSPFCLPEQMGSAVSDCSRQFRE